MKRFAVLALLLSAAGCGPATVRPTSYPDPEVPCPGGRSSWNLVIVDQRADQVASERMLHDVRDGIDGRPDGEVDDPVGVPRREGLVGREGVPREVGEVQRSHSSWTTGGRSLIHCGSASTLPTFDAPPGEPSSSKKSAFALV